LAAVGAKFDANFATVFDAKTGPADAGTPQGGPRNLRQIPARFLRQKPLARAGGEKSAISHWFGRKAARGLQVTGN
jgi:hypothetical protein